MGYDLCDEGILKSDYNDDCKTLKVLNFKVHEFDAKMTGKML